jgi:hypothetical protein
MSLGELFEFLCLPREPDLNIILGSLPDARQRDYVCRLTFLCLAVEIRASDARAPESGLHIFYAATKLRELFRFGRDFFRRRQRDLSR